MKWRAGLQKNKKMDIKQNENLAKHTTFKIGGPAKFFCVARNEHDLKEAVKFARNEHLKILILGGGSNMLVSDSGFDGLVIQADFKGWEAKETKDHVTLKVAAGEEWDSIVELAARRGWWGMENLSHIPGKTGAVAVQNVGAYGQEARQIVTKVQVYEIDTGEIFYLDNVVCKFGYRRSIFNREQRGKYVILNTFFKLSKAGKPNIWYRDLNLLFAGKQPTLHEIRKAVINIRDKKFPYPKEAINGNAGSFFKNVIVDGGKYWTIRETIIKNLGGEIGERLEQKKIPMGDQVKIPAAFLLDACGLKNVEHGNAKINANQPLVIINATGKAKAGDVLGLAAKVLKTVKEKTGIDLEIEPELIGFAPDDLKSYGIMKLNKN